MDFDDASHTAWCTVKDVRDQRETEPTSKLRYHARRFAGCMTWIRTKSAYSSVLVRAVGLDYLVRSAEAGPSRRGVKFKVAEESVSRMM